MFDLGTQFFVVAAVMVFLIGLSKTGFGSGFTALGVPVLSLYVSPSLAAGLLLPVLCLIDTTNLWNFRAHWDRRLVAILVPGALLGVLIGTLTFSYVNADMIRILVGAIALWFAALYFAKPVLPALRFSFGPITALICGAVSGFTSHIAHAGSPPIRVFLLSQSLNKSAFVGTFTMLFLFINYTKVIPYIALSQITWPTLYYSAALFPFTLIGIFAGLKLHHLLPEKQFVQIAYSLLVFAGSKLIWDGVSGL